MGQYRVTTDQGTYMVTTEDAPDWKQTVSNAAQDSFRKPAAYMKDLGTNPVSMANAMPAALSALGGISPIPGGMTMGTAAGQALRDGSLTALKKPAPSFGQHALELGGSALGDVAAIPWIKGKIFGGQIGNAEQGAGVIARGADKAVTPGSVGETLNNLEAQLDSGAINTAQGAKDAKEIVEQIYKNPNIYEKSNGISIQSQRVSNKVQELLNNLVQGRRAPAEALARSQTIPRMIGNIPGVKKYGPLAAKTAVAGVAGTAGGTLVYDAIKKLLGR